MLNKMINFNYSQARYIVLKEFDLRGPIATVLQCSGEHMSEIVMGIANEIEERNIAIHNWKTKGEWSEAIVNLVPDNFAHIIQRICELLPHYILCYSDYNWNEFISAWLEFCNEYIRLLTMGAEEASHYYNEPHPVIKDLQEYAGMLARSLQSTLMLLEMGMGYTQLISSTDRLLSRMEEFKQDRPNIVRVSDAYLASLGYKKGGLDS